MTNIGSLMAGGGAIPEPNHFYPTPPEPTIALLTYYDNLISEYVYEPACGDGAMAKVIASTGRNVMATDLINRGYGLCGVDFVNHEFTLARRWDIITNPPFKYAEQFIRRAHQLDAPFIAMYLKVQFWNAAKRWQLWKDHPPKAIHPLMWRVDFTGGKNATMDCMWCVWGENVPMSNEPFRKS